MITAQNYPQQITPAILAKMPADAREMDQNLRVNWSVLAYDPEFRDVVDYVVSEANKAAQPPRRRVTNYKPTGGPVKPFRSTVREVKEEKKSAPKKTAKKPVLAKAKAAASKARKANAARKTKSSTSKSKPRMNVMKKIGKALGVKPKAKKATAKPKAVSAKKRSLGGRKPDRRTVTSPKVKANNRKFSKIQDTVLNDFYQAGKRNAPKPSVKASYKKAARTLGLGR